MVKRQLKTKALLILISDDNLDLPASTGIKGCHFKSAYLDFCKFIVPKLTYPIPI